MLGNCLSLCVQYKNDQAIQMLNSLPEKQQRTGWVLTKIAECYMEQLEFTKAEQTFLDMIKLEPYRLEGLDSYSTCLWRLKKQVELCQLSN